MSDTKQYDFPELVEASLCLWSAFCDNEYMYPEIMAIQENHGIAATRNLFTDEILLNAVCTGWHLAEHFEEAFDACYVPDFLSYCVVVKDDELALREGWETICKQMTSAPDSIEWTAEDSVSAQSQGWDIFSTSRAEDDGGRMDDGIPYGYRPFEIQRLDNMASFENDTAAMSHVLRGVIIGDKLASKAVEYIRRFSPVEYRTLLKMEIPTQKAGGIQ